MDENADHRLVDGAEMLDGFVRLGQKAVDDIGLSPQLLEGLQ